VLALPFADVLEVEARGARSHREKCAVLLGAALNGKLAVEQVAEVAGQLDAQGLLTLRRVCASLLAALRLGETRVKLYGRHAAAVVGPSGWTTLRTDSPPLPLPSATTPSPSLRTSAAPAPWRPSSTRRAQRGRAAPLVPRSHGEEGRFSRVPHSGPHTPQVCTEVDVLTSHLWSLCGAGGGARASPLTRRRIHRGHWTPRAQPPPAALTVARWDAHHAELWWLLGGRAQAFDLALLSRRALPSEHAAHVAYAGDVTALCADPLAGAVWSGHSDGSVACWGAASGQLRGGRTACLPLAQGCVTLLALAARGCVWVAGARGCALRVVTLPAQAAKAASSLGAASSPSAGPHSSSSQTRSTDDGAPEPQPEPLSVAPEAPAWADAGGAASQGSTQTDSALRVAALVAAPGDAFAAASYAWGARCGEDAIVAWEVGSRRLLARWGCPVLGPVAALAVAPQTMQGSAAACAAHPLALVSAHRQGGVQLWGALGAPICRLSAPSAGAPPVGIVLCVGLACVAHADGVLRLWPLLGVVGGAPVQQAGTLRAHRSGLRGCCLVDADALGGEAAGGIAGGGIVTSGRFGSLALWPATEVVAAASAQPGAAAAMAAWRAAQQPALTGALARSCSVAASQPSTPRGPPSSSQPPPSSSRALAARIIPFSEVTLRGAVGEGSYGTVYQGTWLSTEVAVKVWRGFEPGQTQLSGEAATAAVAEGLVAEVALMQELRHPNIVLLLGVTLEPPAIVQEYCSRGSLYGVLRRHGAAGAPPLAWRVRLQMALGAATGMCYLHGCRPAVLHRDLKSPNLLVDRHWRVKVGDFGLSRATLSSVAVASVAGIHSPRWMAPEVLVDGVHSKASDVFSFAVVLWELCTLEVPWEGVNQWQVMHAVADEKVRCPVPPAVTPPFPTGYGDYTRLMASAWAHEPQQRPGFPAAVAELQRMLDALMASERPQGKGAGAQQAQQANGAAPKELPSPEKPAPQQSQHVAGGEASPPDNPPPPRRSLTAPLPVRAEAEAEAAEPVEQEQAEAQQPAAQAAGESLRVLEGAAGADGRPPTAPPPPTGAAAKAVAARKSSKARRAAAQ